jgi:hypothetical protein
VGRFLVCQGAAAVSVTNLHYCYVMQDGIHHTACSLACRTTPCIMRKLDMTVNTYLILAELWLGCYTSVHKSSTPNLMRDLDCNVDVINNNSVSRV